jgi:hypothetical protein
MNDGGQMLAGLGNVGDSMFEHLVPDIKPTAEEMKEEREAALYNRIVKLSAVKVKTFDLSKAATSKEYAKLIKDLFQGIQERTHVILFNERRYTEVNGSPRWIAHVEWAEFVLEETANPTVGSPME